MHASFTTARINQKRGTGTEKVDLTLGGIGTRFLHDDTQYIRFLFGRWFFADFIDLGNRNCDPRSAFCIAWKDLHTTSARGKERQIWS